MYLSKIMNVKNLYIINLKSIFLYINIVYQFNIFNKYKWLEYQQFKYNIKIGYNIFVQILCECNIGIIFLFFFHAN